MKKLYVGTPWKMNKTVSETRDYIGKMVEFMQNNHEKVRDLDIFILPTFLAIEAALQITRKANSDLKIGAQNCCWEDSGSFTGEVSPMHLKDLGCSYVEIGHAERREIFMETDEMISKKVSAIIRNGMKPILCIGEGKKPSQINIALHFLEHQLLDDLDKISAGDLKNIIIAYEPVWAIGADASAPLDYIKKAIDFLRDLLNKKFGKGLGDEQIIIYGGSVTPESARDILALPNNDGIFIGRAALNIEYFIKMIEIASEVQKLR